MMWAGQAGGGKGEGGASWEKVVRVWVWWKIGREGVDEGMEMSVEEKKDER